ncbi:MAG: esterase [Bacteroidetes bacterium]|nr:esterase [Bacteroidota bacterium]
MGKITVLFVLLFLFIRCSHAQTTERTIKVDGETRNFLLHAPPDTVRSGLPLVVVLHGHGGTGKQIMKETGFNDISDREKFIVVYPDGLNKSWNDGRKKSGDSKSNDVKFMEKILDTLKTEFGTDTSRVFFTGMSNGAFMSIVLSYRLNDRILAIAPICANMPVLLGKVYSLSRPVSVMLINGTDDPLVKWDGGKIGFDFQKARGYSLSTEETISIFIRENHCKTKPVHEEIPDINEDDGCFAEKYTYGGGLSGTEVVLIKVVNGGHTVPGGSQYLPKYLVGNTCQDFKASEMIWSFFKSRKGR